MVELKQIQHFIAVAEELNFRRAAERLHITQPPLSQSIKALEDTMGVRLFDRNTRGVRLTKAGEVFLGQSRDLLRAAQKSVQAAKQAARGEVGELRIGYSASAIFSERFTKALAQLLAERPELELELCSGNALMQVAAVRSGDTDVALLRAGLREESLSGVSVCHLGDEPLYVILPPGHRLQARSSISLEELDGERLLLQPAVQRTFLRRQLEALADAAGVPLDCFLEVPDIGSTLCFVRAGIGLTILPASAASVAHNLVARPLAEQEASQPLLMVYREGSPLSERLYELVDGRR
ncbi:LysR family transcriptional regulator [Marinobacter daepoensis]|uniref:LysR family transcriptional regulator n=1 Tax=Marinobacter daepoensis TaxID=262077 RepID=A0ABS3BFY7_9GAMM|nr:LysR substrate-binding domain-containing protein [Marinobacter daepoensis]MBN7770745.1 LysR family transcriptional regulator [Marinobacter daepoensis]MBY6078606.1 LysR family transcriptional regulator [Marinobacter daepoensis]